MTVSHFMLPPLTEQDVKRFWAKVNVHGPNECWPWLAATVRGYGTFKVQRPKRKQVKAHRIAYLLYNNEDPVGYLVRHTCDNPSCCNPHHLLKGFDQDNVNDALERGRLPIGDAAWPHLNPERMSRGSTHYLNIYPDLRKKAIERLLNADRSRGESHYAAKITEQDVREIRKKHSVGITIASLAREYGFSWPAMRKVIQRKSWAHVTD